MSKEAVDSLDSKQEPKPPQPKVQPRITETAETVQSITSSAMIHPAFLTVPDDAVQLMMTPPTFPLPPGWTYPREEDPVPEMLKPFDLDAPSGKVSLGDGTYIEIEKTHEMLPFEGCDKGFNVFRRRIIKSSKPNVPSLVVDFYDK